MKVLEATPRFELGNQGFAGPRLTTWLCRHKIVVLEAGLEPARKQYPRDFKSLVSTNSTTRALISHIKNDDLIKVKFWSGKRVSNPRPRPWQGRALPLSYSRKNLVFKMKLQVYLKKNKIAIYFYAKFIFCGEFWRI